METTILVVAQDAAMRSMLVAMLEAEGFEALSTGDDGSARLAAERMRPLAIVLDTDTTPPAWYRGERWRRVAAYCTSTHTPLLALTSTGAPRAQEDLDATAAIDKPLDSLEVVRALLGMLAQRRDLWEREAC